MSLLHGKLIHIGQKDMDGAGQKFDEVTQRWRKAWQNIWTATFEYEGRTATFEYFTGCGIEEVKFSEAVEAVIDDCRTYENNETAGQMAHEFGLTDVDEANEIWAALQVEARKMRTLLGTRTYLEWLDKEPETLADTEVVEVTYRVNRRHGKWREVNAT